MDIVLYYAPDTCARVTMIALEETGVEYKTELVSFVRGDHRAPDFLSINPKGQVPTLIVDGRPLTENVAILTWLHDKFPTAELLPIVTNEWQHAQQISDLSWCSSGLHQLVTRARLPQMICPEPNGIDAVRATAFEKLSGAFQIIDDRLTDQPWWYGDKWSVLDAYINWVWFRVTGAGMDGAPFPAIAAHGQRMLKRPSVGRTLDMHAKASQQLAAAGLSLNLDAFTSEKTAVSS